MPTLIRKLGTDGTLEPVSYEAKDLNEAAEYESQDGIYTVGNTFHKYYVLNFEQHLKRLKDSCHLVDIDYTIQEENLRQGLRQMIDEADYGDVRYRITITRETPQTPLLSIEAFSPLSPEIKAKGVKVICSRMLKRVNPQAKTTQWMHARQHLKTHLSDDVYEVILENEDGYLLEGISSNFYAIKEGRLYTAGKGVLSGTAQQIVFKILAGVVELEKVPIHQNEIKKISEAFITSSSRGIVPIIQIDNYPIGEGKPGLITLALQEKYDQWVEEHLELL
ncbi:branched-chain-amino-acid transaminase [Anaerolineales bacterium]